MQNTSIVQGSFTSTGNPVIINIPMSANWIKTFNYTQALAKTGSAGVAFEWYQGMPQGSAFEYQNNAGGTASLLLVQTSGGFTQVSNPSVNSNNALLNTGTPIVVASGNLTSTQSSGAPAVVTVATSSLAPMSGYSIFRITGATAVLQALNGVDFSFDSLNVGAGTFNVTDVGVDSSTVWNALTSSGSLTITPVGQPYWYPQTRKVYYMLSNGNGTTKVYTAVTAPYQLGQTVRFKVPPTSQTNWGMNQAMNNFSANVVGFGQGTAGSVSPYFIIDADIAALGFGTFKQLGASGGPALTATGVQWIEVTPIGALSQLENQYLDASPSTSASGAYGNSPIATNAFNWSEFNAGYNGMQLGAGVNGPAGQNNDVVYWIAGLSFNVYLGGASIVPNYSPVTIPFAGILPPLGQ